MEASPVRQVALRERLQHGAAWVSEVFAPLIPALILGGFVQGLGGIVAEVGEVTGPVAAFAEVLGGVLGGTAGTIFTCVPVALVWSMARRADANEPLALVTGALPVALAHAGWLPGGATTCDVAEAFVVGGAFCALSRWGERALSRLRRRSRALAAASSVLAAPALLVAVLAVSVLTLPLIAALATATVPALAAFVWSPAGIVAAGVFGFSYARLVKTGLHHLTLPIDCEFILLLGMTPLWPLLALVNIAQASAALGVYLRACRGTASVPRADAERLRVIRQACGSCYMGVSEPVLFGVNAQHPAALQMGMVGAALACALAAGLRCAALSIGVGGLPGILTIAPESWPAFALAMLVAIVVPCVGTVMRLR